MLSPQARATAHALIAILVALIEGLLAENQSRPFLSRLAVRAMVFQLGQLRDYLARRAAADPLATPGSPPDSALSADPAPHPEPIARPAPAPVTPPRSHRPAPRTRSLGRANARLPAPRTPKRRKNASQTARLRLRYSFR